MVFELQEVIEECVGSRNLKPLKKLKKGKPC